MLSAAQGHGAQVLRLQQAVQRDARGPVVQEQRRGQVPPPLPQLHRRHRLRAGEQGSRQRIGRCRRRRWCGANRVVGYVGPDQEQPQNPPE
uniref:Uncharacterized protein n=1 Tax=Zea mays TaxID=4577 RepID=C4J703_MAIZE|nr:unknown [Zea mays]|eukprot:NP_001183493.1 uncharacterized LOC100501926 [Zea mays]